MADDATWTGPGSEWIGTGNWSGGMVPDGTATLGGQPQHAITADGDNTIGSIVIGPGAPAYTITVGGVANFTVNGAGIVNTPGSGTLTFQNNGALGFVAGSTAGHSTIHNDGGLFFDNNATAGNAAITNGALSTVIFVGDSSAGSAAIVNNGGLSFFEGSTAGNATITTTGGAATYFGDWILGGTADGGDARFITESGGMVDFSLTLGANNDGQISAGSIEGAGDYFIGHGNTLTVGGNNRSTEVSGLIADDCNCSPGAGGRLVKAGTGTLTLSGDNSYSGGTVIAGGTLRVEHDNALGTGALTTTGSTLDYASGVDIGNGIVINSNATKLQVLTGSATQSGDISETGGARGIEKTGAGMLILSGDNSYTGQTKITAGTLLTATSTALAEETDVVIGSGASLAIADGIITDINSLSGGGSVLIGTADPDTILGIGIAGGATTTYSGSIAGAGSLELLGGALTLTGDSDIDGSLWVCDCSTLTIDGGSFAAAGGIEVGGTLGVTNGGTLETGSLAIAGTMRIDGRGSTVSTDQGGPFGGPGITAVAGRLDVTAGATLETDVLGVGGTMRIAGPGSVVTASPDGTTFISDLGGPALLSIEDGGVLNSQGGAVIAAMPDQMPVVRVSGAGSTWNVDKNLSVGFFTAPAMLTIADGAVVNSTGSTAIGHDSILNLGTGGVAGTIVTAEILNNGEIRANFTGTSTLSADITGVGSLVKSGAGTFVLSGDNSYSGGTTLAGGTLRVEHDNALGTGTLTTTGSTLDYKGGIDIGNDIVVNSNATKLQVLTGTATQSGDISETGGARGIEKTGAGMLVLSGDNSYTGQTKITAGTLLTATNTALAEETDVVIGSGASLAIDDDVTTDINSLSGGGSVLIGTADYLDTNLRIGIAGGATTTFSGSILGAGSLELRGGALTLTGDSDIERTLSICECSKLTIDGGSFAARTISVDGELGVTNGGTLEMGSMNVIGAMRIDGRGSTVSMYQGGPFGGPGITVVAGRLDVTSGATLETDILGIGGTMRIAGQGSVVTVRQVGSTLVADFAGPALLSIEDGGVLNSQGGAVIGGLDGNPMVRVSGAGSTWNVDKDLQVGFSEVSATLTITDGGVVNSTGLTSIGDGGTLNLGTGGVAGTIVTAAIVNDGEMKANFTGTSTLAADIGGNGSLIKAGAGTFVLSGDNSYSGGTTLAGGTLRVEHDNALGTGTLTTTGSTLDYASGVDIGNDIVVNSNTTKLQVLTGIATQSGDISETGGSRGIEKTGTGMLVLSGDNSYTGQTTITAGTLLAATDTAFAKKTDVVVGSGGTLAIDEGISTNINSLSGSGIVLLGMADPDTTLAIGAAGGATTSFSGTMLGGGSLDIAGGALTLTGESEIGGWLSVCQCGILTIDGGSFGAGSTVVAGEFRVTNGGTLETNDLTVSGTMRIDGRGARVVATQGGSLGGLGQTGIIGRLDVTGGATLETDLLIVGGTMRIVGQGSVVTAGQDGPTIVADLAGPALLRIEDGGVLNSQGGAAIGAVPGESPMVRVGGAGSTWNVDKSLAVGHFGAQATLTITNGAVVNSTGFTTIGADGTLNLGTGGLAGAIVTPTIVNDGEIKANFTNTLTLGADIEGHGSLVKSGAGTLVLSGRSSYTGTTAVDSGGLVVNGRIDGSHVTVNDGATLGGSGIVGATTINDGGAIAPGNSIGVLTVAGDLTFASGSLYTLEVSTTGADRIDVAAGNGDKGVARLTGGTVRAVSEPGSYVAKRYVILHADGGLGGTKFAGLNGSALVGFKTSLSYDPNTVWLDLDLVMRDYTGLNRNQQHVADALTGFFDRTGGIPAEFAALTPQGLTFASGEVATGSIGAGLYAADRFLEVITDPFVAGRGGRADGAVGVREAPRQKVWGAVYGGSLSIDGDAIVGSHDTTQRVHGIAAGYDHDMGDGVWGFALGGADASFDLADGLGSGDTGIFNAGLYATQNFGQAYLTGALAYGWNSVSTTRAVGADELSADFDAQTFSGRIETGYRFDTAVLGVTPYAAFQASSFFLPGYDESAAGAGTFALSYDGRTTTATRVELGARLDKSFAVSDAALLTLRGRAAWVHDGNTDRSVTAVFQELPGAAFIVDGAARAQNSGLVNASAEINWTNGFSAGASFQGEFASNASSLSGSAKLSYRW